MTRNAVFLFLVLAFFPSVVSADETGKVPQAVAQEPDKTQEAAAAPAAAKTESSQVIDSKDVTTQNAQAAELPAPASEPPAPAAETAPASSPGNVTVDFKEADIQNVLRILSFKSGVNIVAGKDVTGTVTIRLVDVPWEKALEIVLKTYGYAYEKNENIIRVTTLESLKKEDLSTEVFPLSYATAAEVEKSIKNILSERGKLQSDTRSNTVIVTDMPTTLQRVKKVIERLDQATPQVVISAKVIELTLGTADKLGIKWNASAAVKGSSRPTTLPWASQQQTLLQRFLPFGKPPQETVDIATDTTTTTVTDFQDTQKTHFPLAAKTDFQYGTLDFTQFQAALEMIKSRSDAKVLSEPHITTLNNKEAKVQVGETISIPKFERNTTTGRMEITGYTDKSLGITLLVTPQINNQNDIVVDINPAITSLLGYDSLTADIKAPHYTTREAKTQVRIQSGQTIVIGGLIKENIIDTETKVPLLGDIPFFYRVFRHQDKQVSKSDILFFMTVDIMDDKSPVALGHPASPAAF